MTSPCRLILVLSLALLAAGAEAQPRAPASAGQLFVRGLTLAQLGDNAGAIAMYEQALARRPGEGAIHAALSEAHEAEGDLTAALFHAQRAAAAAPTEPEVHRALARLHLALGDAEAALQAQERLVALLPRSADALAALARMQQQTGRAGAALATYEQLLELIGEGSAIRVRMLGLYRQLGDLDGVAETLSALLRLDPGDASLVVELASVLKAKGEREEAALRLEAFLEVHPGDPLASRALDELYREDGNETAAAPETREDALGPLSPEEALRRAAALYTYSDGDPRSLLEALTLLEALAPPLPPPALLLLGDLRYRLGRPSAAAVALTDALDADPAHPAAWSLLAAAHLDTGDASAAAVVAEEGLLLFPGQYPLLRAAVLAHTRAGRTREGIARAREALALLEEEAPGEPGERALLLVHLGLLYARSGDEARAEQTHAQAVAVAPDDPWTLRALAYALAEQGDRLGDALRWAEQAADLTPGAPDVLGALGRVHLARGEYEKAAYVLRQAAAAAEAQGSPNSLLLEHLGDAEAALGRTEEATRRYREALTLDPHRRGVERKLETLR